jgi:hypothetical protein
MLSAMLDARGTIRNSSNGNIHSKAKISWEISLYVLAHSFPVHSYLYFCYLQNFKNKEIEAQSI